MYILVETKFLGKKVRIDARKKNFGRFFKNTHKSIDKWSLDTQTTLIYKWLSKHGIKIRSQKD